MLPPFKLINEFLQLDSNNYNSILEEIALVRAIQPILIHVRRGGYLTQSTIFINLTQKYYMSGIRYLKSVFGEREVWLISDDPDGAMDWLGNEFSINKILSPSDSINPDQYLEIMSHCKSIVTANSTFSWWGAYLGYGRGNTQGIVMPSSFRHNETTSQQTSLGIKGWHVLNANGDLI